MGTEIIIATVIGVPGLIMAGLIGWTWKILEGF